MKLRNKILFFLFLTMSVFLCCLYFISSNILLQGYDEIEDSLIAKNTERFKEIFANEEEVLKTISIAWSTWDESFNFVQKPNRKHIDDTYKIDTFFDSQINAVVIFNLKGEVLFSQAYNLKERRYEKMSAEKINFFQERIFSKFIKPSRMTPLTDLYIFKNLPIIFSLNPILPGSGKGLPNGFLLFERNVEGEFRDRLEKIIKFKSSYQIVNWGNKRDVEYLKGKNETTAKIYFPDVSGEKALQVNIPMPRNIYIFGEKVINRYFFIIFFCSFCFVMIVYMLFNKYVVKRILRIQKELNIISHHDENNKRVTIEGVDEIEDLATNINSTLDTIDRNQAIINRSSKLTALGEIAASIAHEINNPLTVIGGYSTKINSQLKNDQFDIKLLQSYSQKISSGIVRISQIIHSLKVISQDGENDSMVKITSGSLIDDILPMVQVKLSDRNIRLDLTDFALDVQLEIKPIQMTQVLVNLINNAIDAIAEDPAPWIKISLEKKEKSIEILVVDNGKTIPPEVAANVMNPFFTTKSAGKGTGLGLSISKKFIEAHGGHLSLSTNPHTCFKITIPQ